jgi:two-component system OmpR family response regulator
MKLTMGLWRLFVLVVDSEGHRRQALVGALRALGAYVGCASSGEEALRYVNENEPDALLSDWTLPDMEGLELARRITQGRFRPRFILQKEGADWRSLRETLECGGEDVLSYPFTMDELLRSLRRGSDLARRLAHPGPPASSTKLEKRAPRNLARA